jgi:L-fuconolactonase
MPLRLDSHQHFWRYNPSEYGWITESMGALRRDFLPADLRPLLNEIAFDGCVAVQARQNLEETCWLLELADHHPSVRGVVGWVDLRSPGLRAQLESFASKPKLVGVRHVLHDEPDDRFMLGTAFRNGIGCLKEFSLTYDLLLHPRHLPVAVELAETFPGQPFVLDHIAKPSISTVSISPWRDDLRELAKHPAVYCKLSGMVTEAAWRQWQASDFYRYIDTVIEAFGVDRVMIGSDWPVCTLSGDYGTTMHVVIDYVQQFPPSVRAGILGENCARFYGLP